MSHPCLMSPPPRGWRILGAENYRSRGRPPVSPRRAFVEWLALADAIEAAGGAVAFLPASEEPLLTGLPYTANAGWLRGPRLFRLANVSVAHRRAEQPVLAAALSALGFSTEPARALWEGQADMCHLPGAVLLTYGVRSVRASVEEVAALLPAGVRWHAARLRDPFFHGDTCMDPLPAPRGPAWLAFPGAFASHDEWKAAQRFAAEFAEPVEISEEDALAYGCNSLPVGETLLMPAGLTPRLRDAAAAQGYALRELDFTELFGKGGGGPRCLVNELRGLAEVPAALSYATARAALASAIKDYPASPNG